ncbi:hypothetical protein [Pseudoscardovia radai]|uniref:hypothetical protein n=1 Tax=Pseudoscardovia radai TaxID=987066 RepID=UPI00117B59B4|nr:hypothetical protein [Pseudoscardovia radai]
MGSGALGYSPGSSESQPYAKSYAACPDMLAEDKKDPEIYAPESGYFLNPSAFEVSAESAVEQRFYCENAKGRRVILNGKIPYVLDISGKLIAGIRNNPNNPSKRSPHPTLVGGLAPRVQCAGMLTFREGKIVSANLDSGHFRPARKSLAKVESYLAKLYETHPGLFDERSQWAKSNGASGGNER